jgi:hypothetical protein
MHDDAEGSQVRSELTRYDAGLARFRRVYAEDVVVPWTSHVPQMSPSAIC